MILEPTPPFCSKGWGAHDGRLNRLMSRCSYGNTSSLFLPNQTRNSRCDFRPTVPLTKSFPGHRALPSITTARPPASAHFDGWREDVRRGKQHAPFGVVARKKKVGDTSVREYGKSKSHQQFTTALQQHLTIRINTNTHTVASDSS